jgi:hypothetical protein
MQTRCKKSLSSFASRRRTHANALQKLARQFCGKQGGMEMYKKLIDPKEEQVNEILQQGYELHSVSVVRRGETHLWYHFIKHVVGPPELLFTEDIGMPNPFEPRDLN